MAASSSSSSSYDLLFKYISVGDSGVGKSCLLLRFTNHEYTPTETTIGIEFGSSIVTTKNKRVKLQIWDTAGQESFRSISRAYYRGAIGCLLVYDMTRRDSFLHIKNWLDDVTTHGHEEIKVALIANKADMLSQRQVSSEEGLEFARKYNTLYLETSAKSGQNVEEAFTGLAEKIFDYLKLNRDISSIPESEVKRLESRGVKMGPQQPLLNLHPPLSSSSGAGYRNSDQGCC